MRDEADALGLLAADGLAQQQVVLRLRHAAQQRPDDRRVIAGRHAEPRVPIDDARLAAATEMSASIAAASPAPTPGPSIADTIGLEQLITL